MSLFKFPRDGFTQIAERITQNPKLLKTDDYHSLPHGTEAMTEEEIMRPYTAHCLIGWIIAITPRAAAYERMREDVVEFANEILVQSGRLPIPMGIVFSDEESMRKVVLGRAAEERQLAERDAALSVN